MNSYLIRNTSGCACACHTSGFRQASSGHATSGHFWWRNIRLRTRTRSLPVSSPHSTTSNMTLSVPIYYSGPFLIHDLSPCGGFAFAPFFYLSAWSWRLSCCQITSCLKFRVLISTTTSEWKLCSICLESHLFCIEFLFCLCYLYLFTYTGVQIYFHIRWCSCCLTSNDGFHIWSKNCQPFQNTWVHPKV